MRGFQFTTGSQCDRLPERQTERSAGYDFYSPVAVTIMPKESVVIHSGIKCFMGSNEVLLLFIRSSLGIKKHLLLTNCVGVIDSDYYNNRDNEGEIMCELYNRGTEPVVIKRNERYMQGVFVNYLNCGENIETKRVGGIGSTTINDKETPI